ncbi:MAG: CAAX prenyl protease-related protein [Bryobacteraceae bacterium]
MALIPGAAALGLSARAELLVRLLLPAAALLWYWRDLPPVRVNRPVASVVLGVFVFAVWIAPDLLFPGWRSHWLFQNALFGRLTVSMPASSLRNPADLLLRSIRACTVVALAEELFWRGWFMRYLIRADFESIPVGAWQARAFFVTAALFAVEHGPYWEVGLAAGLLYNWWALRSRSLGDLILAHCVTNAVLAVFVITTRRWEYWM